MLSRNKGMHIDPKSLAAFGPGDAWRYAAVTYCFTGVKLE
jgi:hypothetical protein